MKKVLKIAGATTCIGLLGVGAYVSSQVRAFDASLERVYSVALPVVALSDDPQVMARGSHLAQSLGGCAARDCHGSSFSGGRPLSLGPLGTIAGPNITEGGMLGVYSDAELARLIRYGVKKDGRSVRMMPVQDFYWLDDSDVSAIISFLRRVPRSENPSGATHVGVLGKLLDRQGKFVWDVARFVETLPKQKVPAPSPTRDYGQFVVRLCTGCHGETLSGGPLPGAPPSFPIPSNITTHATGIKAYTFEQFSQLLKTGIRRNGTKLDPFMAIELTRNLNDTELRALWSQLQAVPPKPFGGR